MARRHPTIGYFSCDEVNLHDVRLAADELDLRLAILEARDQPLPRPLDALIIDLDCWPPSYRRALLQKLQAAPAPCPVAVHSYHLDDEATTLLAQGVMVFRALDGDLVRAVCGAAGLLSRACPVG